MKVTTVNKESRAKAARHRRVLKIQSLRSGISPIAMGSSLSFLKCKASASDRRPPRLAKGILYRKALRTDLTDRGGLVPIAFGADSVASALHLRQGRDPQRTRPDYHALTEGSIKTGTFYFAGKRNFLICLDKRKFAAPECSSRCAIILSRKVPAGSRIIGFSGRRAQMSVG